MIMAMIMFFLIENMQWRLTFVILFFFFSSEINTTLPLRLWMLAMLLSSRCVVRKTVVKAYAIHRPFE